MDIFNREYFKVFLDLSYGSAYQYNTTSKIPTKIKFCRKHDGKYQKGVIDGDFTHEKTIDLVFSLKRGLDLEHINKRVEMDY